MNLPKYPNPKDFETIESLMIPYTQAFGTSEAVRQIFSFMDEQKFIYEDLIQRNETNRNPGI